MEKGRKNGMRQGDLSAKKMADVLLICAQFDYIQKAEFHFFWKLKIELFFVNIGRAVITWWDWNEDREN